jgi:hypothetical protein
MAPFARKGGCCLREQAVHGVIEFGMRGGQVAKCYLETIGQLQLTYNYSIICQD